MNLTGLLDHRIGIDELATGDVPSTFTAIVEGLVAGGAIDAADSTTLHEALMERETSGSTAFQHGFALPHVFCDVVDRIWVTVARHPSGLDMAAADGERTTVIICIVGPEAERDTYLSLLRGIAGILRDGQSRRFIHQASTASEIFETLLEAEIA
ncbi:MAG: PTS sugar transporter subunit IIA [Planctomycetes bacterium]|nr:PTS sugar transporter subunit IIA [Planctomycetota bacterium]